MVFQPAEFSASSVFLSFLGSLDSGQISAGTEGGQSDSLDSQEYEGSNQDARGSPNDVGGSPPVAEDIQVCQINTEDVGQAVAEVDAPGEDAVGDAAVGRAEQFRDEGTTGGATGGFSGK